MLIDSKYNVPYVYRNSRDYQAILKLLDLILAAVKEQTDDFLQILNPETCPEQLLPLLASYVGYDYDFKESVEANRIIIANYQYIIHNRGSETGMKIASALSFNAIDRPEEVESAALFDVVYSKREGKVIIYIYYPNYLEKIRDLLERARPAGVRLSIVPAYDIRTVDKIEVHDYIHNERMPYDKTRYNVGESKVRIFGGNKQRRTKGGSRISTIRRSRAYTRYEKTLVIILVGQLRSREVFMIVSPIA